MFEAPKLYNPVIRGKELYAITFVLMKKFDIIDFFFHLNTLKMIELRLMWLNLLEIAIIEVTGIFQVSVPEHYNTASSISDSQVLPSFIICHSSQDIWFIDVLNVSLTQPINIYPAGWFGLLHLRIRWSLTLWLWLSDLVRLIIQRNIGSASHVGVDNLFGDTNRNHSICLIHLVD